MACSLEATWLKMSKPDFGVEDWELCWLIVHEFDEVSLLLLMLVVVRAPRFRVRGSDIGSLICSDIIDPNAVREVGFIGDNNDRDDADVDDADNFCKGISLRFLLGWNLCFLAGGGPIKLESIGIFELGDFARIFFFSDNVEAVWGLILAAVRASSGTG